MFFDLLLREFDGVGPEWNNLAMTSQLFVSIIVSHLFTIPVRVVCVECVLFTCEVDLEVSTLSSQAQVAVDIDKYAYVRHTGPNGYSHTLIGIPSERCCAELSRGIF